MGSRRVTLVTADGLHLQGDRAGAGSDPIATEPATAALVVCHPHPLYGGDRFNSVVDAVFRRAAAAGFDVLRFDFRGVGRSEGTHDDGNGETLDVVAAIDLLASSSDAPIWVAGYSFGAAVALGVTDPRLAGWLAIAPPLAAMPGERAAGADARPKHLLVAGRDQFGPPEPTRATVEGWLATDVTVLPDADHFLGGHLDQVADWTLATIHAR